MDTHHRRRSTGLLLISVMLAALTACATTVPGTPSTPPGAKAGDPSPTCPEQAVAPSAGHYCFAPLSGFTDVTDRVNTNFQTSEGLASSAFAIGNRDAIAVTEYTLRVDTDKASTAQLGELVDGIGSKLRGAVSTVGEPRRLKIDGAPGAAYDVRTADYTAVLYFVFRGTQEIEINCQYAQKQSDVERACAAVLRTIRIKR